MPDFLRQFGKNMVTGWVALALRMLIVLLVNPFIIHSLGNQLYGLWALLFSIINYMTILDLGLQQALVRYVSKFLGLGDYKKINAVLNTSFIIYSVVGAAVMAVTAVLSFLALPLFKIPVELADQGRAALVIIGLNTALNFIMLPWGGSLGAFHRYDIANGIAMVEDIIRTLTIVWLLKGGHGIIALATAYLVFSMVRQLAAAAFLKRLHPPIKIGWKLADRETFGLLYNYGAISFLISVAWMLIANTDNLIIGYFLDTSSITFYAIAATMIVAVRNLVLAASSPLRPLVSHYEATGAKGKIRAIYLLGTKYLYFLTFMAAGVILIFGDDFIVLWMGPGYEKAAAVLKILVVPAAVYLPQAVGNSILYGLGRHRRILYALIAEGILNLTLSVVLVGTYGIIGVAIGTMFSQLVIYIFVLPQLIGPILEINMSHFYLIILKKALTALAMAAGAAYVLSRLMVPAGWPAFIAGVAGAALITLAGGYLLSDRKEIREIFDRFHLDRQGV